MRCDAMQRSASTPTLQKRSGLRPVIVSTHECQSNAHAGWLERGVSSNAATEQLALEHLEHEQQAKRDHEEPGHKPHISR
jgi:hypothetical protein